MTCTQRAGESATPFGIRLARISPLASRFLSNGSMTLYLTVANCGRVCSVTICAMMFPPNAGRICTRSVLSRISRRVQSAVRPVWNRVESLGASDLPSAVAPTSTTEGFAYRI